MPSSKKTDASREVWPEIGSSGLRRSGGLVQEEFLPELRGKRAMRAYREMRDNSAIVGACLTAIEMLIRQVSWSVEPGGPDPDDVKRAAFVDTAIHDLSSTWQDVISEVLSMLPYGWALLEIVYKRRLGDQSDPTLRSKHTDGLIGWRKLPLRAQESLLEWVFDNAGGVQAMRQVAPPDFTVREVPIQRALLFRARPSKNSPEGTSVLRSAYFSWVFSRRIAEIEGVGIERDLAGLPVAYIPAECMLPDATDAQKATRRAVEEIVTSIKRDEQEGVVFPLAYDDRGAKRYELTLLSTGGSRQFDTSAIIERYDRRIAMALICDVVMLGHAAVGSYALSSDKRDLLGAALNGWLDSIAAVFNEHGIPRLMRMNGWPTERCPRLVHADVQPVGLSALGDYISKLNGSGVQLFPDPLLEDHLRRAAGLPKRRKVAGE